MSLNEEQRAAVEYLDGPLLVLAGPGTGKTQLLSAKVAHILEVTDANPENILCLTFTDAGAENMRERLRSMIGPAAQNVNISTYHAFGRNLLERYQNYAENPERRLDSAIDATLQYKIVSDIQKTLPAMDILRNSNIKDILETIGNAKSARLTGADLAEIAERNMEDSINISLELSPILEAAPTRAKFETAIAQVYQPILEVLAKYTAQEPITKHIERIANSLARELNLAIKQASASEKPSVKPLTAWKNRCIESTDDGGYRLKDYIANKKLLSLANIMTKYDEELSASGLFDFNDMIEWAIHFLKTDPGFKADLSELFQYVLLDEFQDTNASQFELIKLLTDYEQPVIMAVGDDDQAIYEFQGANASNLLEFQNHYHAKIITLVKNYRSGGEILSLSRQVAGQISDSFSKNFDNVDKTLTAMSPRQAQIMRHEFPCSEAEYLWLAQEIRQLIASGQDPSEIAVLAPKHRNLVAILPYLKNANIDITYEKRENILLDEKVMMLICLARFTNAVAKGESAAEYLPELLSFEFWELPPVETVKLFPDKGTNLKALEILEKGGEKFQVLAKFLAALVLKSQTAPLELWLDYAVGVTEIVDGQSSPFLKYYQSKLSEAELLEFYENLATLRQTALSHAANLKDRSNDYVPRLPDLVAMILDYQAADAGINRISNYRDQNHAVQVMTAFKSKGLEFRNVFLIAMDELSWGKAKGNNNFLVLPRNLTQIRHTGVSDDERLRVLFVAMTRAKDNLIITNSRTNTDGKAISRLAYLNESSLESECPTSPFLPKTTQRIQMHCDELNDAEKISALQLGWLSSYQKFTPDMQELMKERVANYRLSASDLTNFIDLIYAGPESIYQKIILHAPEPPATFEQCYGTLIHQVFEQVTTTGIDNQAALELFRNSVSHTRLEQAEQERLLEGGLANLEVALREFGQILRSSQSKAEVNLSPEHLTLGDVPLVGKIDHIKINQDAKTIELYDFKTGKFHPEKWSSHPTLYKYRLQLGFYKLLLNLSPTFCKYQVLRGHILFVTPDDDGKVYDKVYEYNDIEEKELKDLMRAVYWQIKNLNFVNDPEIFQPANKSYSMKQIREFVEKLLGQN